MKTTLLSYIILHLLGVFAATSWWQPFLGMFPASAPLVLVSGLAGGLCRMLAERERIWPEGAGSIISGGVVATFLWPIAHPAAEGVIGKFDMEPAAAVMFGGFVTGLLGIAIATFILDLFRARTRRRLKDEGDEK